MDEATAPEAQKLFFKELYGADGDTPAARDEWHTKTQANLLEVMDRFTRFIPGLDVKAAAYFPHVYDTIPPTGTDTAPAATPAGAGAWKSFHEIALNTSRLSQDSVMGSLQWATGRVFQLPAVFAKANPRFESEKEAVFTGYEDGANAAYFLTRHDEAVNLAMRDVKAHTIGVLFTRAADIPVSEENFRAAIDYVLRKSLFSRERAEINFNMVKPTPAVATSTATIPKPPTPAPQSTTTAPPKAPTPVIPATTTEPPVTTKTNPTYVVTERSEPSYFASTGAQVDVQNSSGLLRSSSSTFMSSDKNIGAAPKNENSSGLLRSSSSTFMSSDKNIGAARKNAGAPSSDYLNARKSSSVYDDLSTNVMPPKPRVQDPATTTTTTYSSSGQGRAGAPAPASYTSTTVTTHASAPYSSSTLTTGSAPYSSSVQAKALAPATTTTHTSSALTAPATMSPVKQGSAQYTSSAQHTSTAVTAPAPAYTSSAVTAPAPVPPSSAQAPVTAPAVLVVQGSEAMDLVTIAEDVFFTELFGTPNNLNLRKEWRNACHDQLTEAMDHIAAKNPKADIAAAVYFPCVANAGQMLSFLEIVLCPSRTEASKVPLPEDWDKVKVVDFAERFMAKNPTFAEVKSSVYSAVPECPASAWYLLTRHDEACELADRCVKAHSIGFLMGPSNAISEADLRAAADNTLRKLLISREKPNLGAKSY